MPDFLADEKFADIWANWPAWLMDLGFEEQAARRIVGMVFNSCEKDATRTDWIFRKAQDSRTVSEGNVVSYLLKEVEDSRP